MKTLKLKLGKRSYPIFIDESFDSLGNCLKKQGYSERLIIITDENVDRHQGKALYDELESSGIAYEKLVLKPGEENKNLNTMEKIYTFLHDLKLDRKSVVAGFGGGVIGDMTGFAAATFLRGINLIQIPTTLLAQADSSVGGKTGIDFMGSKNMIGSFYQPKFVYININTIKTLPEREIRAGLAETIKHGLIQDKEFYTYLKENIEKVFKFDQKTLMHISENNCRIKASVVKKDEKEAGLRAILNLGHTFGHAIETVYDFKYIHGECVSLGIIAACELSLSLGMLKKEEAEDIKDILISARLPVNIENPNAEEIYSQMFHDKKLSGDVLTFILPLSIGKVIKRKIESKDMIIDAIKKLGK